MVAVSCEASRETRCRVEVWGLEGLVLSKHVICEAQDGGNTRGNRQGWRGAGRSYEGDTGVVECS